MCNVKWVTWSVELTANYHHFAVIIHSAAFKPLLAHCAGFMEQKSCSHQPCSQYKTTVRQSSQQLVKTKTELREELILDFA